MNIRYVSMLLIVASFISIHSDAQVMYGRPGMHYGTKPSRQHQQPKQKLPRFVPVINLSAGVGFPIVDKMYMPLYSNVSQGTVSQKGPFAASLDYQFSRTSGIGVMVTHANMTAPYYDYYFSSTVPAFTASIDNWSFLLNIMRYLPSGSTKVTPYLRTAIGVNSWKQTYTDENGDHAPVQPVMLPDFAYQAALGAKFNFSSHAGIFIEAGYGKYILHGGLALKF